MALVPCEGCGRSISEKAAACPGCGRSRSAGSDTIFVADGPVTRRDDGAAVPNTPRAPSPRGGAGDRSNESGANRKLVIALAAVGAVAVIASIIAIAATRGGNKKSDHTRTNDHPSSSERSAADADPKCALNTLKCDQFSTQGRTGRQLHELVFSARGAGRNEEAICLAQSNMNSTDGWLAGATHFEVSHAWEALGCHDLAVSEINLALQRPRDRSWRDTCDWCKQLHGSCDACKAVAQSPPPPCPKDLSTLSAKLQAALKTTRTITMIQCAPGVFPRPGYLLVAWADFADQNDWQRHHTILGQDNSLIADMSEDVSVHERQDNDLSIDSARVVDFDGDGRDEILEETTYTRRGWLRKAVSVVALDGATLTHALDVTLSYSDEAMEPERGPTTCEGTSSVSEVNGIKSIIVKSTRASGPDASRECTTSGTYQLHGSKFALVK